MESTVIAVSSSQNHTFSKPNLSSVTLVAGVGVEGDAHSGRLVKHTFLVRRDPTQPNLRQVHLIQAELFNQLESQGYTVAAGELGENITTRDIDLLSLPTGTRLHIGPDAVVELSGLRNPCTQINDFQQGLMPLMRYRNDDGSIARIAGVMGVVSVGGDVRPGDSIDVEWPAKPHVPLAYVANSHNPVRTPWLGS